MVCDVLKKKSLFITLCNLGFVVNPYGWKSELPSKVSSVRLKKKFPSNLGADVGRRQRDRLVVHIRHSFFSTL